jgi:hypothetical protein
MFWLATPAPPMWVGPSLLRDKLYVGPVCSPVVVNPPAGLRKEFLDLTSGGRIYDHLPAAPLFYAPSERNLQVYCGPGDGIEPDITASHSRIH